MLVTPKLQPNANLPENMASCPMYFDRKSIS